MHACSNSLVVFALKSILFYVSSFPFFTLSFSDSLSLESPPITSSQMLLSVLLVDVILHVFLDDCMSQHNSVFFVISFSLVSNGAVNE